MTAAPKVESGVVARGVLWRITEVFGTEILAFATFVLLARLLAPDDFGIISQASLFILAAQLVLQQGFPEALVQMEEVSDAHFETSFWANLALGGAASLALIIAAPWLASVLTEPDLTPVLVGLAPTLLLLSANRIYLAKLRRELRFRDFMLINVLATFAGALAATILATGGYGLWSLVAQQWFYALTGLVVGCARIGWLPGLRFDMVHLRAMWAFSGFTVLEAFTAFCARRADLLILAWFWSAREIGFYFLANRLLFSAGMLTYYSISHLGLPFLARLQNDPTAYREALHRTMQLLSLACMPTLIGLTLVAPIMIPLLFGAEWAPSVPPFQALAALSIFYAFALMCGQILIAAGHARDAMILSGLTMLLFLAAVAIAAPYGITHAAVAGGLANLLVLPVYFDQLRRRFGFDLKRCLKEQLPCWTAMMLMITAVLSSMPWMKAHLPPIAQLLAASLIGTATFFIVMVILARGELLIIYTSFCSAKGEDRKATA
ncbi:MAG: lipopolysaccharide biosynthesis protein [Geminicoccaceae bacterium]